MKSLYQKLVNIVACVLLYGCASSPPVHFYLLDMGNTNQTSSETSSTQNKLIGIGPVRFPDYLDRPQIVTRASDNELVLSDIHRWAEPLEENFTRILAEQFSRLLGKSSISIEPSRNRTSLDVRITVDVIQFDTDSSGEIHLISYWRVENPDGSQRLSPRRSNIRISGNSNSNYPAIVNAMSEAVTQLAIEIANELSD